MENNSIQLDDKYWQEVISNPNKEFTINRKILWSIWNVITSTPFENRNEHWEHASEVVKRLLNTK